MSATPSPGRYLAPPYTAKHCARCDTWILAAYPPFAENDPTKPMRGSLHWKRCADPEVVAAATRQGPFGTVMHLPFMRWNEVEVEAVLEDVTGRD